jgi:hypothetical protein
MEINCETGDITVRPLTGEEVADIQRAHEAYVQQLEEQTNAREAAEAAKASAQTKLQALGLTAEEIAALSA